ncbi:MAG: type VI secretion system contractile sheath large subunit [Syntrophobacterales bacterium]|nr:type VI secretion system contractile sheath large subunit [Syntrophobacterales bacterium]
MKIRKVPFTILSLAPFRPTPDTSSPEMISVAMETLDNGVAACRPQLWIPQPADICPAAGVTVSPTRMKDVTPDGLIRITPYLKDLHDAGEFIERSIASEATAEETARKLKTAWPLLPLDLSLPVRESRARPRATVDDILSMVAVPGQPAPSAAAEMAGPKKWKNQINDMLARLLKNIFDSDVFRLFEAAWRGVEVVIQQGIVRTGGPIRLLIVPADRENLPEVLEGLVSKLIPDPPNLILIDIPLDNTPESLMLMEKITLFADMLLAPTAIWITPGFFRLHSWHDLGKLPYLRNHLDDAAHAKWRKLQERAESRWLVVTCNRFLTRQLYGEDLQPRTVRFREREPLWISPVWALGALVSQSIVNYHLPSRLTDYVNIRLEDLAVISFENGTVASTEVVIPDDRIRQLQEAGFMPLTGAMNSDAAFMSRETTASGEPLLCQLLLSHIIGFLIQCRRQLPGGGENSETDIRETLNAFFRDVDCEPPADMTLFVERAEPGEPVTFRIAFTPSRIALPVSRRLEFTFLW